LGEVRVVFWRLLVTRGRDSSADSSLQTSLHISNSSSQPLGNLANVGSMLGLVSLLLAGLPWACLPLPGPPAPYKNVSLASGCGVGGHKQNFYLNKGALLFHFNSSEHHHMGLDCHLEIHVHSKALGISVFIDTLEVDSSLGCSRDFLQFGRDKFIITTYQSAKYCRSYPPVESIFNPEDGSLVGYEFHNKSYSSREYVEHEDVEMDIWLKLLPNMGTTKLVKLLVAPTKRGCVTDDYYKRCDNSPQCFKRELFCEKVVKCSVLKGDDLDRFCPSKDSPGSFLYLPVIIIIIVFSIITFSLLGFGLKILVKQFTRDRHFRSVSCTGPVTVSGLGGGSVRIGSSLSTAERQALRERPGVERETCNQPAISPPPPSYSEVVSQEMKELPPKYDDIVHHS